MHVNAWLAAGRTASEAPRGRDQRSDAAVQAHGGNGMSAEYGVGPLIAAVRTLTRRTPVIIRA